MARKKLTIRRLESVKDRQTRYSKRKSGILKKAKELSVLCDIDLALVMFSPSGKPSLFVGQNKELLSVVDRLATMSIEDREQRRDYTIKLLKKLYANTNVDLSNISLDKIDFLKLQQDHLTELNEKIAQKTKILNEWKNPENIMDLNKLQIMHDHLAISLYNIRAKKRQLRHEQEQEQQRVQASQRALNILQEQIGQASQVHLKNEDLSI